MCSFFLLPNWIIRVQSWAWHKRFPEILKNIQCSSLFTAAAISFVAANLLLRISLSKKKMKQCWKQVSHLGGQKVISSPEEDVSFTFFPVLQQASGEEYLSPFKEQEELYFMLCPGSLRPPALHKMSSAHCVTSPLFLLCIEVCLMPRKREWKSADTQHQGGFLPLWVNVDCLTPLAAIRPQLTLCDWSLINEYWNHSASLFGQLRVGT